MTILLVALRDQLWAVRRGGAATGPGAGSWTAELSFTGNSCLQCVAVDPWSQGRIYCGTSGDGLWRSDDLGGSWTRVGADLRHQRVTAVAVSLVGRGGGGPSAAVGGGAGGMGDAGVVAGAERRAAGAGVEYGDVYAGAEPSALFRSADGGASWEECTTLLELPSSSSWSFPPRPETHHIRWIAPDPLVPERLFVAIEAGALVSSTDAGRSWTDRQPGGPYDTHTLIIHPAERDRLYSAAGDGYFESRTGGVTWEQPESGLEHRYLWSVAVDPHDPELVLVSAARSARPAHNAARAESWIYRKAAGEPWRAVTEGLPEPAGTTIGVLVVDPTEAGHFYAANNRGVYHSVDLGESWERLDITWPEANYAQRVAGLVVMAAR